LGIVRGRRGCPRLVSAGSGPERSRPTSLPLVSRRDRRPLGARASLIASPGASPRSPEQVERRGGGVRGAEALLDAGLADLGLDRTLGQAPGADREP